MLSGTVVDTLGARLAGATVTLLREGQKVQDGKSGSDGAFSFTGLAPDRYQVQASMPGFQSKTSEAVFLGQGGRIVIEVTLEIGPLQQEVVVTAGATEQLQSRTGAPVTVIDEETIEAINKLDVLEALRLVPAAQIVQVGQRGGATSLFLRGGESNFTKVLIDGIPANDIGGGFDFSQLTLASVERIEVLRQTNSVIYGSDALTGVVNISTRRGTSRVPALDYMIDGGNLGTFNNALSFGGAYKRFDYFSQVPGTTRPTTTFRTAVIATAPTPDVSAWLSATGPTSTARFAISTAASATRMVSICIALPTTRCPTRIRPSSAWRPTRRSARAGRPQCDSEPPTRNRSIRTRQPSGIPFDPFGFGANYLGEVVTLEGADGRTVTGQGILDYDGTYPSSFPSRTARQSLFGQATFQATRDLAISAGGRFEHEAGYSDPDADPTDTRNNGGAFVEATRDARQSRLHRRRYRRRAQRDLRDRVHADGCRWPHTCVIPPPSRLGETKVTLNIGKGIKAPSVYQGQNSLFALVNGTPAGADVDPLGPEKSRSFDVGLEQAFAASRFRARVGYFNNTFESLLEFLSRTQLVAAGVPPAVAAITSFRRLHQFRIVRCAGCRAVCRRGARGAASASARRTRSWTPRSPKRSAEAPYSIRRFPRSRLAPFRHSLVHGRSGVQPTRVRCSSATRPVLSRSRCPVTSRARVTTARS